MSIGLWIITLIGGWLVWIIQQHYIGLSFGRSKQLIEITYNSGRVVTQWYRKFKVTYDTTQEYGRVTGLEWALAEPIETIYWGIRNIESIRVIDHRVNIFTAAKKLFS